MPEIGTHPTAQQLVLFGHGKLSEAQAATVAAHLETCADCRHTVATLPPDSFLEKVRDAKTSATMLPAGAPRPDAVREAVAGATPDVPPELANHPKFRIARQLGRGGMGVIYLAEHRVLQKRFALKVINPSVLDNPGALARFQTEARAVATLDHANIARCHDADQAGELHFLVMEYVEGMSLWQLLQKKGPLSVASACHCVCQAALGLQHAFEHGMAHRDIKPQNLMLTPKGQVKVLDFGLARMRGPKAVGKGLTEADSFMGTPEYVSPEQATDARQADIRADIYSLGCTLYALLTGRPPFQEDTMVKLVMAHIEKQPPALHELRPDVPAEVSAIAAKMLAKDPGQRYQRPVEVAQALAPFAKAGSKARPAGAAPVKSATTATVVGGDTSRLKEPGKGAKKAAQQETEESPFRDLDLAPAAPSPAQRMKQWIESAAAAEWLKRPAVLTGAGAGMVLLVVLLGLWATGVLRVKTKDGTIVLENLPPDAEVTVDGAKVTVKWTGGKEAEISVKPGTRELAVTVAGIQIHGQQVSIEPGEKTQPIRITWEPPGPPGSPPPGTGDLLQVDSVWQGEGEYTVRGLPAQPVGKFHGRLRITERTGDKFKGTYEYEDGSELVSAIEGTLGEAVGDTGKRKIRFEAVKDLKGDAHQNYTATLDGTIEGAKFIVGLTHKDRNTGQLAGTAVMEFRTDAKAPPAGRFVSLFDGKDLKGWKTHPSQPGNWRVWNDAIVGSADATSHLYTERGDYKDFHLRLEIRINEGGNSGIYFRSPFGPSLPAGASQPRWLRGYNAKYDRDRTGGLLIDDSPLWRFRETPQKTGEWVPMEVIAIGNQLTIKIDGSVTALYTDEQRRYTSGHIVLQQHTPGTVVEFRKIEIREIPPEESDKERFVSLFNGKDLSGWKTHPSQPGQWRVFNSQIVGSGSPVSHLYTERGDYRDFHLRVEARINEDGNSGVYFRAPFGPTIPGNDPKFVTGYNAKLVQPRMGALLIGNESGFTHNGDPGVTSGEWVTLEVIASGEHIQVKVNGKLTADYVDGRRRFTSGHIVLQQHGAGTVVQFRKIEIKELPAK
jgi:tRNA A-37 threonylcarbamoyl transferase component Bud32